MIPSLFISHGSPNTILYDNTTKETLNNLTKNFKDPKYIVIVSAHWSTRSLEIISPSANKIMYDFYGFEKELYEYKYDIKSDLTYTNKVLNTLKIFDIKLSNKDSFDHGVWTVLSMMYKKLEIPVINISLPLGYSAEKLFLLGQTLKSLRGESLLIFSGSITHNLYDLYPSLDAPVKKYAYTFNEKIKQILKTGDKEQLLDYESIEYFKQNHPTKEHFLPMLIALGTSKSYKAKSFNNKIVYSNLSMQSFIFED
ncbi:dioxygenase [Malaciobacter molluscorum LMG 25693]|uniref:Dioxygenase n=1 Tax=Malaciobacter molluscorum LMG 25693 TaxID=870501 RepID=A0A2G1DH93_9BACT|nr:class III extradiol ring-cleavage dioxygenase [Malaciobacter molluscorum]AXX91053.1 dioxygenase, 4,5-DOPA dioxygenase family [Malaciobacter molluscorum LMG 25693]PHO17872.1 dioxygenase [Malaciobacter molluscorum LMG 25693]